MSINRPYLTENGDPIVCFSSFRVALICPRSESRPTLEVTRLTGRIYRPSLIIWVALEEDVEEDDEERDNKATQGDVVHCDQSRARHSQALVKQYQRELDRPQRCNIQDRTRHNHLHDAF